MLHPKHNRIDYGEQLIPPVGYELARAIGTSYSLDLEALMILPVALFYAKKIDGKSNEIRYDMLDSITKAADKITMYYQKGQLKVPKKYHYLMAYWENGIQSVTMPHYASSFHPKVWVIRYESKDEQPKYRVLITSRNLTFSRDWDIAFSTEGIVTDKEQLRNKPLVHFLKFLNSTGKKNISDSFINELFKVKFDLPDKFDYLKFVPIGIPNPESDKLYLNPITTSQAKWHEMLIVSPFVDKETLLKIHQSTFKKPCLLCRKEELDSIEEETLNLFECWEFNTFFEKAEFLQELDDETEIPVSQNLHAKLFVAMLNKTAYWYLGSANCSDPAQKRNIEFMVELEGNNPIGVKTKDIFQILTTPEKSDGFTLFTPYNIDARCSVEEIKKFDQMIRKLKYDLSLMPINGKIELIEGGTIYKLLIEIDARNLIIPIDFQVKIKPLPEQQKSGIFLKSESINIINDFGGYAETALSIFIVFEICKDGIIYSQFLLPMEIDLPKSRLNKIFTSIIDSRDKFLKYLIFLLTGEETGIICNENLIQKNKLNTGNDNWSIAGGSVYEKLLIASSRFPEKLKSIDNLIQRLKTESVDMEDPIITAEFESFWNVFQTFINNKD